MMLLRSAAEGKLLVPVVGSMSETSREERAGVEFQAPHELVEAAILSMSLSASIKQVGDATLAARIDCPPDEDEHAEERFMDMVEADSLFPPDAQGPPAQARRMFECLVRAYRAEQEEVTRPWVRAAIRLYRHLCGLSFAHDSDSMEPIGYLTELFHAYLDFYRHYGVLQIGSLGAALAQHLRIYDLVPTQRRAYVKFGEREIPTCPVDLLRTTYQADSGRKGLEAIKSFAEAALTALEAAESLADMARRETQMARFLPLAHKGALAFHAANTALGWILNRYQTAGSSPPDDLWKERQVAEEHRVEVRIMLDSMGGSLITEPITHLLSVVLVANRRDPLTKNDVRSLLLDGCARNPFYPDVLVAAWSTISEEVTLSECRWGDNSALSLGRTLQHKVCDQFSNCFEDKEISDGVRRIQDQWYFSEAGYNTT